MKRGSFGLKTRVAVCMLLFSFVLLPISPSISMGQQSGSEAGAEDEKVEADDSAAGAAKATAKKAGIGGLTTKQTVAIIAGVVAVAAGVAAAADDDDAQPTTEHP
jgi:hypothetical protein